MSYQAPARNGFERAWKIASLLAAIAAVSVFLGVGVPWASKAEMAAVKSDHGVFVTKIDQIQQDVKEIKEYVIYGKAQGGRR